MFFESPSHLGHYLLHNVSLHPKKGIQIIDLIFIIKFFSVLFFKFIFLFYIEKLLRNQKTYQGHLSVYSVGVGGGGGKFCIHKI